MKTFWPNRYKACQRALMLSGLYSLVVSSAIALHAEELNNTAEQNSTQYQKVVDVCTKAIELDPKDALAYCNRAETYRRMKQYHKAYDKLGKHALAIKDQKKAQELGYKPKHD